MRKETAMETPMSQWKVLWMEVKYNWILTDFWAGIFKKQCKKPCGTLKSIENSVEIQLNSVIIIPDGECDHEELCDDEGREGDGDHVDELVLEQQQSTEHDYATCKILQFSLNSVNSLRTPRRLNFNALVYTGLG